MEEKQRLFDEEKRKLEAKMAALEKEKSDLAKKLDDAKIYSKRQSEVRGLILILDQGANTLFRRMEGQTENFTTRG
jgi:hypothetical protein